jgi:ABC-2 type transport system ATP-binding protein
VSSAAIEVQDLSREYQTARLGRRAITVALDGVSLSVGQGEIHGLLGPNGAGKTTLVKILSTVLLPSGGSARVSGFDVVTETDAVRRRLGIVFGGERGLYTRLTARRNLLYWGALYRLSAGQAAKRASDLLERVGLQAHADERVENFSRGMKQRLHLARGLISDRPSTTFASSSPAAAMWFGTGEVHGRSPVSG